MVKADYMKCDIAVGGDLRNVYHATNLTWPEINIMRELHGEQSVSGVVVTHIGEVDPHAEFERIRFAYPETVVRNLYPGVSPNVKFEAPDYIEREVPKATPVKKPEPVKHEAHKAADLL